MQVHGARVAIVGGLTRATAKWLRAGADLGLTIEHHDGNAIGARADSLVATVRRADVVIVILLPNSHNAVAIARRAATLRGTPCVIVKRLSPNALGPVVADALASASARSAELAR